MSSDINLIINRTSESVNSARIKKIKNFSFILLFFVGFLSLLFFLINFRYSVNYVKKQEADLIKSLSVYDATAAKILLLNSRLGDISTLLDQRKKYNVVTQAVLKGKNSSMNLDEYRMDSAGISMEVSSTSLKALNDFINHLLSLTSSNTITSVTLENLSQVSQGYEMSIIAN